jgi:acetyl-CoA carboxylase carboxyl transferase subunit alpha
VIPEPPGGAHEDYDEAARFLQERLVRTLDELSHLSTNDLLQTRYAKFRKMGSFFLG